MGLGDVYLGAPVATPLDPRHRLVTTKYNPARTWTPENAVGIGGAYMCIYGMEGPGGYRICSDARSRSGTATGRRKVSAIHGSCRFFDQIRFYPVEHSELMQLRHDILTGRFEPKIEDSEFRLADYDRFLADEAPSIEAFRLTQRRAFAEERERWKASGADAAFEDVTAVPEPSPVPAGCLPVVSPTAGALWKILVKPGQRVEAGETVAIVESMKMELVCMAPDSGTVECLLAQEGQPLAHGQNILAITPVP